MTDPAARGICSRLPRWYWLALIDQSDVAGRPVSEHAFGGHVPKECMHVSECLVRLICVMMKARYARY
jgi:hypothetical protein